MLTNSIFSFCPTHEYYCFVHWKPMGMLFRYCHDHLRIAFMRPVPNLWGSIVNLLILLQNIHTSAIHVGTITAVEDVAHISWCFLRTWRRCANSSSRYKVRRPSFLSWFPTMRSRKLSMLAGKPAILRIVIAKTVQRQRAADVYLLPYASQKNSGSSGALYPREKTRTVNDILSPFSDRTVRRFLCMPVSVFDLLCEKMQL